MHRKSSITKRRKAYARISAIVARHPGAELLTTEAQFVEAPGKGAHRVVISCGATGHPPWSPLNGVLFTGGWCARCAGKAKKTDDEARREVEERGGRLGSGYKDANSPLEILCQDGHPFTMSLSKIVNAGQWCPVCRGSKEEAVVRYYLEVALGIRFELVRSRPAWLVDERGARLELDGLSEEHKIAFEYQGEHHYRRVAYGGRGRSVAAVARRDRMKLQVTASRGIRLIVVPTLRRDWSIPQAQARVLKVLAAHFPDRKAEFAQRIAAAAPFVRKEPSKLAAFRKEVEERAGRLLAEAYQGYHRPHPVECSKGHRWNTSPASVHAGYWCPRCARDEVLPTAWAGLRERNLALGPERLERLRSLLAEMNCTLLEDTYKGCNGSHQFICNACRKTWTRPGNAFVAGRGCPACGLKRKWEGFKVNRAHLREQKEERRRQARLLRAQGATSAEIAKELGVTLQVARAYLRARR